MSSRGSAALLAAVLLAAGCAEDRDGARPAPSARVAPAAPPSAPAPPLPPRASASARAVPAPPEAGAGTPAERALAEATLASAKLEEGRGAAEGLLDVRLEGEGVAPPGEAVLRLATTEAPVAHKRRLAFHRLASALGAHVVAPCVERRVSLAELGEKLGGQRAALELVGKRAAIDNDGMVPTLWMAVAPEAGGSPWSARSGAPLDPYGGGEPARWSRWLDAPEPEPEEVPSLVRDWLEMIALDYLAATSHRRSVFVVRDGGARGQAVGLVLFDNANAFSPAPSPSASSALLRRLRAAERYPRALRDRLAELTPERARALFAAGPFERWLLPPRALIELEERRAALLSLIEAKAQGRGEASVLVD